MFADSKTLKESKREELFECIKVDNSMGWAVDVIDPRVMSSLMLAKFVSFNIKYGFICLCFMHVTWIFSMLLYRYHVCF